MVRLERVRGSDGNPAGAHKTAAKKGGPKLVLIVGADVDGGCYPVFQAPARGEERAGVVGVEPSRWVSHRLHSREIHVSVSDHEFGVGMQLRVAPPGVDGARLCGVLAKTGGIGLAVGWNFTAGAIEIAIALAELNGPPLAQVACYRLNAEAVQVVRKAGKVPVNPEVGAVDWTPMAIRVQAHVEGKVRRAEPDAEGGSGFQPGRDDLR